MLFKKCLSIQVIQKSKCVNLSMYLSSVQRLLNLVGRRSKHTLFPFLLQTHFNSSSFKPPLFVDSSQSQYLGTSSLVSPRKSAFCTLFLSTFCSSTSKVPQRVEQEDEEDEDEDEDEDDGDDDFEVGGEMGIGKDSYFVKNVEILVGILGDFERSGVEAKDKLEQCSVPVSTELVVEVLSRVRNDWNAAFTFFLWAGKQPEQSHGVREYHSMISILGKMRKFDTAWSLIDEMRGVQTGGPSLVTPQTLVIMIRKYSAAHDVGKAINTFYALKRFKFDIGIDEFQDLLSALCRYKNVEDAEHLLFCNEKTFPFDTKSFNIVLNGWGNIVVNLREAKRFWRDMGRRGIMRDTVSYSTMISCYSKASNLNDVLKLFNQMKELGIAPDRKVYNAVIYALAKGKLVKEALNLLKTMEEKGFAPNVVTYNSLIKPLCKARRVDEAKMVFDEMLDRGFSPSMRTYHAYFGVLKTAEEVFELLEKMKNTGCLPINDTCIMLIRKFCRWRQLENVYKLWNEMAVYGLSPDRSSYIVLIHGLFLNGKLEEAWKYYDEMKEKGFSPEPKTDEMLQSWFSAKQIAGTEKLDQNDSQVNNGSSKKHTRVTTNASGDYQRDFLKQPEIRTVTRERGFSFWEK